MSKRLKLSAMIEESKPILRNLESVMNFEVTLACMCFIFTCPKIKLNTINSSIKRVATTAVQAAHMAGLFLTIKQNLICLNFTEQLHITIRRIDGICWLF